MAATKITPARMQTQDYEINQLQSNLINALTALSNQVVNAPSNGKFLNAALTSGNNTVTHNMGSVPNGYIIVSQDAAASIYQVAKNAATITLNSSAPVNISLFTF